MYARLMRRKLPDTWVGSIVVGVAAGLAGGPGSAVTQLAVSGGSVSRYAVPDGGYRVGIGTMACLIKYAYNLRRG
jgi:hypothetical protein